MSSLIEALAARYQDMNRRARAASGPSPTSESLVYDATRIIDAIAEVEPTSDRDALLQGLLLLDHLNFNFDAPDEQTDIVQALARSVVRHFARESGIDIEELAAYFRRPRPVEACTVAMPSRSTMSTV